MSEKNKETIFRTLKGILGVYSKTLDCTDDSEDTYNLYTKHLMKNKKPLYFGGVKINKAFVSYHLMPLYVYPELINTINGELKKLLKGKSCFNIKSLDDEILNELISLIETCYTKYVSDDYV